MDVLELAESLWRGKTRIEDHHPFSMETDLAEVAEGVAFVPSFANVTAFATSEGLVLVDTGSPFLAASVHEWIRGWSELPVHTAIYTHGHVDHVFGVPVFEQDPVQEDRPIRVVAHEAVPRRFDRYRKTAGYNAVINQRQFQIAELQWPTEYRYPDETYREQLTLEIGGLRLELYHGRGETDDHTWVWVPDLSVLCCGDFFIWTTPNAGNPQKVQRYAGWWAEALRQMSQVGAEILLPGHGLPILGAERIATALQDAAELLEHLETETLAMMNEGASLDEIIHTVKAPRDLLEKPYLRPIYDEPEFIVRNIWRLYGGWYEGNPAHLKPAPQAELARELAALAGGPEKLADRARELVDAGNFRLACHLAEMAGKAAPEDEGILKVRSEVYRARAEAESSVMSRGIFNWAASR